MSDLKPTNVGYMKPPAQHQFKKGKSGNPNGRSKTVETPYTALQKVLDRKVSLAGGGGKIPIREALLLQLRDLAHGGNRRAVALQQRIIGLARPGGPDQQVPDVTDVKDRFLKLVRAHPDLASEIIADD